MKDYITEVIDNPVFRTALMIEAMNGSPHCHLDENTEAKLNFTMVPVKYTGVKSAGVCRLSDEEKAWFESLPMAAIIGEAKATNIVCFGDIEWVIGGEARYYAAYNRAATTYTDEYGEEQVTTPPLIQGVLASADMGKLYKFIPYDIYNESTEVDGEVVYTNAYKFEQPDARVSPDKTEVLVRAKGIDCVSIGTANKYIEDNWSVE